MLGIFEYYWAEFAWELQRVKTIAAVRKALHPIREMSGLELFVFEPTEKASLAQLRELRRALEKLRTRLQTAIVDERRERERFDNAQNALRERGSDQQLQRLCESRQKSFLAAEELRKDLEQRVEKSREDLKRQGAYICQSELLDFVVSKRYAITPLNLANALAGLPFISWRHSAGRCKKLKASHPYELIYEMFQHVARALASPPRTADKAIEQLELYLRKRRPKNDHALQRLKDEFHYLKEATQAVYAEKPRRSAIPYRVFAGYQRRSSSRSSYDQLIEEEERL